VQDFAAPERMAGAVGPDIEAGIAFLDFERFSSRAGSGAHRPGAGPHPFIAGAEPFAVFFAESVGVVVADSDGGRCAANIGRYSYISMQNVPSRSTEFLGQILPLIAP